MPTTTPLIIAGGVGWNGHVPTLTVAVGTTRFCAAAAAVIFSQIGSIEHFNSAGSKHIGYIIAFNIGLGTIWFIAR